MNETFTDFDIASHLNNDGDIALFLDDVAANGTTADFIHALGVAARAKGMTNVAKSAGITRASLYKSLAVSGNPKFETINKVTHALGLRLSVQSS